MGTRICIKKLEKWKKLEGFGTQWSNLLDFAIFYEILNDLLGRWIAARIAFTTSEQKFFIFHVKFAKTEFFGNFRGPVSWQDQLSCSSLDTAIKV